MGRADRAGAEHDLDGLNRRDVAVATCNDRRSTPPLKQDALDFSLRQDREVRAGPRGMNVPDRRAPAVAVGVIRREWPDAGRIRGVEIRALLETLLQARFEERRLGSEPLLAWPAADWDRAAGAVIRRPDVENGSTCSKLQAGLPAVAQASKSSGMPRRNISPLMALEPPITLPRGTGPSPDSALYRPTIPQVWSLGMASAGVMRPCRILYGKDSRVV
jgi:hypothetical protein